LRIDFHFSGAAGGVWGNAPTSNIIRNRKGGFVDMSEVCKHFLCLLFFAPLSPYSIHYLCGNIKNTFMYKKTALLGGF
jgi:hypothetical protein